MKSETIVIVGSFIFGAIGGAVGAYLATKDKYYEKGYRDCNNELREHYMKKAEAAENWEKIKNGKNPFTKKSQGENPTKTYQNEKEALNKYITKVSNSGYVPANAPLRPGDGPSESSFKAIEVIPFEEVGKEEEYDKLSYVYHAGNDILEDEVGEIVDDREGTVGANFVKHFGEFEDDECVYVVNHNLGMYFSIELDTGKYPIDSGRPMRIEVS